MITKEGNPFVIQYKDQCEVLIKEYKKYQEKQKSKITEEENADIRKAVKFSGDSVKAVNVMTCVRENGVTELL